MSATEDSVGAFGVGTELVASSRVTTPMVARVYKSVFFIKGALSTDLKVRRGGPPIRSQPDRVWMSYAKVNAKIHHLANTGTQHESSARLAIRSPNIVNSVEISVWVKTDIKSFYTLGSPKNPKFSLIS